jgi:hypothetical protein
MIKGHPDVPQRAIIFSYPTPRGLQDVVFRERRDGSLPKNTVWAPGDAHPDTAKYPYHKLITIVPDSERGWDQWIYAASRDSQQLYNWETESGSEWPRLVQTFVIPRDEYDPTPADSAATYPPPPDLFGSGELAEYVITSISQGRDNSPEVDPWFVVVNVVRERLSPLEGQEFDSDTGDIRTVIREKVPAGATGSFDEDTGTIVEVSPINSMWSIQTTKQANGIAGKASGGTYTRSFPEVTQYSWPAVLNSFTPYTTYEIPLRAGGTETVTVVNLLRARFNGPCVSEVVETWTKNPPSALALTGAMSPTPIEWPGKLLNLSVEPTLHAGFQIYETSGTEHPVYDYYYLEQWVPATNLPDWPAFVVTEQQVQPYFGGFLSRHRKIYNPHTHALSASVLLSITSVTATTVDLQWLTGVTGTASVFKRLAGGSWSTATATGLTGHAYRITGLSPFTAYEFKVDVGAVSSDTTPISTLYAVPVITSTLTATARQGTAFAGYTVTASGPATSFAASNLPAGMSINATTGVISGTPTAVDGGNITIGLSAINDAGAGEADLVLTYTAIPHICTSATLATRASALTALAGNAVAFSYQLYADNTPTSFAATGLPTGLTINTSTGLISGTKSGLSATTAYAVVVTATNAAGTSSEITLTLTVRVVPVVSSDTSTALEGSSFYDTVSATESPTSYGATGLPAGLSIDTATGIISGTPTGTTSGTASVTISATNIAGTGTNTLSIIYTAKPTVTAAQTFSHAHNASVSISPAASNSPTSWNYVGTLSTTAPSGGDYLTETGLSFNYTTGQITGTASGGANSQGIWVLSVEATNAAGTRNAVNITITIS